ncbi:hypothetical protein HOLleu_27144 [Holothuria leucospilota]|uniref:Uncharacterized protein n=1 Tax=Holothuria leucospilota TaxID=206669 RepID=A0A9Q1H2I9_HOLLE|nr:hypothetical protein HOLleu_27144 [Holothuria leucospilota]
MPSWYSSWYGCRTTGRKAQVLTSKSCACFMGTRKKSKKARSRSRSRSRDSDYSDKYRGSRSKRSSRRRSSSRSSSSDSRGDRYRSRSRTPEKRRKKRSRRRSRSTSRSKQRRKSRSRSRERFHKPGSRSKDNSGTSSPAVFKEQQVKETVESPKDVTNADAQLREQGILTSMTKNEILTQKEEKERQKKLAAIEKEGFRMQSFQSSAQTGKTLSASKEEKEERWFQRIKALRKQRLEGKPVPIRNDR